MAASVADCVVSHVAWMSLQARACGGETGRAGAIDWALTRPGATAHLLFPRSPQRDDVVEAVRTADRLGAAETAVWSAADRKRPWLRDLGFRRGWQPWWMGGEPSGVRAETGSRAALVDRVRDHDGALAALPGRPGVLLAEAIDQGRYAGRAWMHLDGEVAGLYDMAVWPAFRRRGIGRELLGLLVAEAARRGATRVVMNATPEGAALYSACGFTRLGEGRTWWRRRPSSVG